VETVASITSAVVLAAGASSRMGSPKALLRFGDRPAIAWLLESIERAGITQCVVVTAVDPAIGEAARRLGAAVVVNADPSRGRTGSLQAGLAAVTPDRWILVAPVDCPLVGPSTIRSLLEQGEGAAIVRPRHGGVGGHPLLLAPTLRAEVEALSAGAPLRDILRRDPSRVRDVEVDDAEVVANLDTPADHEAALTRFSQRRP